MRDGELLHTYAAGQAPVQRLAPTSSGEHLLLGTTSLRLLKRKTWKGAGKARLGWGGRKAEGRRPDG